METDAPRSYFLPMRDEHDWRAATVPDGHDPVPGWRCTKCGEEITRKHNEGAPRVDLRVYRWTGRENMNMSCGEYVAMQVLKS